MSRRNNKSRSPLWWMAPTLLSGLLAGAPGLRADDAAQSLARLRLASDLAARGRAEHDALLLLAAARVLEQVELKKLDVEPVVQGRASDVAAAPVGESLSRLLQEAESAAGQDEKMLALIAREKAFAEESRRGGVTLFFAEAVAPATGKVTYTWEFKGREFADLRLESNAGARLGLTITDAKGNTACKAARALNPQDCNWTPSQSGMFSIVIENLGPESSPFRVITN